MTDEKDDFALDAMVKLKAANQDANSKLGITQEYNKENRDKLWDSK